MQERREALFDLFGFGLGSDESEQVIVGLCRPPDYAACGGGDAGRRRLMAVVGRHNSGL